jgi:hypothetical protein
MIDLDKQGPRALIRHLGELLTAQGVDYETDSTGTMIGLVAETATCQCGGVITAELVETQGQMNLLQVGYALPFEDIPEERWGALYELLALLAPHLVIGHFEFDHELSELRWRGHQLLPISFPWDETRLMALPLEGVDTVGRLYETVRMVVADGDDPNVAVAEMLLAEDEALVQGLYESEILRMLKVARRRLTTQEGAELERVSGLLMKLAQ